MHADHQRRRIDIKAATGVAAIHIGLGYALLVGLNARFSSQVDETLKVFDIAPAPPPPPIEEPKPAPVETRSEDGAAAPPNLRARPVPVIAPPLKLPPVVPSPIVTAPVAGLGPDASAGAAAVAGPGTGAGGEGEGTGSGDAGDGTGGGIIATRARYLSGRIVGSDYPRGAGDAGVQGTVVVHFNVREDGHVDHCRVAGSSGNAELDATTCRIVESRFRYEPARDANGRYVPDVTGWKEVWWIGSRRRAGLGSRFDKATSAPGADD